MGKTRIAVAVVAVGLALVAPVPSAAARGGGARVVLESGGHRIVSVPPGGGRARTLVSMARMRGGSALIGPAASTNGRRIAYGVEMIGGGPSPHFASKVLVARGDGSHPRRIAKYENVGVRGVGISADGRAVAVTRQVSRSDDHVDVFTMRADGSRERRLTHRGDVTMGADFSPDGRWVVFATEGGIFKQKIGGGGPVRLTSHGFAHSFGGYGPRFSPDGRSIAFYAFRPSRTVPHLFLMTADGGRIRRLPGAVGFAEQDPAFSPSGRDVAFDRLRVTHDGLRSIGVYAMRLDGSKLRLLTHIGAFPDWTRGP